MNSIQKGLKVGLLTIPFYLLHFSVVDASNGQLQIELDRIEEDQTGKKEKKDSHIMQEVFNEEIARQIRENQQQAEKEFSNLQAALFRENDETKSDGEPEPIIKKLFQSDMTISIVTTKESEQEKNDQNQWLKMSFITIVLVVMTLFLWRLLRRIKVGEDDE